MVELYEQAMSMCDGDPERVEAVADDLLHEHIFKDFNPTRTRSSSACTPPG